MKTTEQCKKTTIKEYQKSKSIKGKHPSWKSSHVRILNRSWNSILSLFPCQGCNYSKHVELCHIKPITSFDENTELGVVNDPENILVLCRNCHWEFDNNQLLIENIPCRPQFDTSWLPSNIKCLDCGKIKDKNSIRCRKCSAIQTKKEASSGKLDRVSLPGKEELEKLVWEMSFLKLSKLLNVSDVSIRKRCKKYNITTPPVGYWSRSQFKQSKEK
jgi:hypothetical protein